MTDNVKTTGKHRKINPFNHPDASGSTGDVMVALNLILEAAIQPGVSDTGMARIVEVQRQELCKKSGIPHSVVVK